jgi:SH3-like domain-containing protein
MVRTETEVPVKLSPLLIGIASLVPSVASAEMLSVKAESAKFVSNPMAKEKRVVFTADKLYPVEVLDRKSGWVHIKDFEGDSAWVAEKSLGKQQTIVIDATIANMREKPSTSSDVLFKVAHGEVFKVEERKADWLKVIDTHGDGGWIRSDMTWGIEDDEKKLDLDKKGHDGKGASKGDEKAAPGESKAKVAHEEKSHAEKAASDRSDGGQCVCQPADDEKSESKPEHADLTKKKSDKKPAKPAHKKGAKPQKAEKKTADKHAGKNDKKKK